MLPDRSWNGSRARMSLETTWRAFLEEVISEDEIGGTFESEMRILLEIDSFVLSKDEEAFLHSEYCQT